MHAVANLTDEKYPLLIIGGGLVEINHAYKSSILRPFERGIRASKGV